MLKTIFPSHLSRTPQIFSLVFTSQVRHFETSQTTPISWRYELKPRKGRRRTQRRNLPQNYYQTLKVPRKRFTYEQMKALLNNHITMMRGGKYEYDGGYDRAVSEIADVLEKANHVYPSFENRKELNHDAEGWLFNASPDAAAAITPGRYVLGKTLGYRKGLRMKLGTWKAQWKESTVTLPVFERKPPDPFRHAPNLIHRISFKNPDMLCKFLSPGGNILNPRYTGVRRSTQRRIKKEIFKARFLGLLPFTGNPEFIGEKFQPVQEVNNFDYVKGYEALDRLNPRYRLEEFLSNIEHGMSHKGNLEWIPPRRSRNPKYASGKLSKEYKGQLPHQIERKKEEMKKLRILNMQHPDLASLYRIPQVDKVKQEMIDMGIKFKQEQQQQQESK